jgi:hypothetical protein
MTTVHCTFCGKFGVKADEHFFPLWSRQALPIPPKVRAHHFKDGLLHKIRGGAPGTEKLRDVCQTCNGGWMNQLQTAARPFLEPCLIGSRPAINTAAALVQWCVMTGMCIDAYKGNTSVVPRADRTSFSIDQRIPLGWHIFVGSHDWEAQRGWFHTSATHQGVRNAQFTVVLFGKILIGLAWVDPVVGFKAPDLTMFGTFQIHPFRDERVNLTDDRFPSEFHPRDLATLMSRTMQIPPLRTT